MNAFFLLLLSVVLSHGSSSALTVFTAIYLQTTT